MALSLEWWVFLHKATKSFTEIASRGAAQIDSGTLANLRRSFTPTQVGDLPLVHSWGATEAVEKGSFLGTYRNSYALMRLKDSEAAYSPAVFGGFSLVPYFLLTSS